MNKITRGNVDVQPYAFTTKSLFVGHCDYKYLRWQVIDTPGILDHPLEERNTIEMQAIIALAHLQCSVLYFIDISEQCGYTVEQQCSLFRSIMPLFANKQLIIAINKIDVQPWDTLESEKKEMVERLAASSNCTLMPMSNMSEQGVSEIKAMACDKLLESRVDARISGKKVDTIMNRLQVFTPAPRDDVTREAFVPESVIEARENGWEPKTRSKTGYAMTKGDVDEMDDDVMVPVDDAIKTARDEMWENGGPGVWAPDYRVQYDLKDPEWRFDAIPEIIDGKNISDFIDPDIMLKLEQLEKEEEQLVAELEAARMGEEPESDLDSEEEAAVYAIRSRKAKIKDMKLVKQTQNKPMMPHAIRGKSKDKHDAGVLNPKAIKEKMDSLGVDASAMIERGRSKERLERGRKRDRSLAEALKKSTGDTMDVDELDIGSSKGKLKKAKKASAQDARRSVSLARSHTRPREPSQAGLKDEESADVAKKLDRQGRKGWNGGSGEGDQRKAVHLVKWMNTGKKRNGTHYCR